MPKKKARLSRDGGGQLIRKSGKIMCSFSGAKKTEVYLSWECSRSYDEVS